MRLHDAELERLAPVLPWQPDWNDVLDRAGEHNSHGSAASRRLRRRLLLVALIVLAVVVIPIAALGAANDWWFFRAGAPAPVSTPVVVKEGEWSGHAWRLVAYPSTTDGVCVSVIPQDSGWSREGGVISCASIAGFARADGTDESEVTITYMSGFVRQGLPPYIVGPVIEQASEVEIRFADGERLRVPTFGAPASLGHVRFFATQVPASVFERRSRERLDPPLDWIAGLNDEGAVVACLAPMSPTTGAEGAPLLACH